MSDGAPRSTPDPFARLRAWWAEFPRRVQIGIVATIALILFPALRARGLW